MKFCNLNKLILFFLIILISGCKLEGNVQGKFIEQKIIPVVYDQGKVEGIYFCPRDDCSQKLSKLILNAKERVHCAFFDLDLDEVINALNQKSKKIDVKVVVDKDNYEIVEDLDFVNPDTRSAFMHNKFCVIDNKIMTGSFNPTINGAEKNNNNFILIQSSILAKNYEDEFKELWNGEFGRGNQVQNPVVYLNETRIENYFCPEDLCSEKIKKVLEKAEDSIYLLVFSFTHDGIANKIVIKMHEGISVKGVFEKRGAGSEYSKFKLFEYQEADVRKDNNSYVMHHKIFIIDNSTVITGSFNPSSNADKRNDENILIIYDKEVASKYLEEFEYIWKNFSEITDL